MIGEGILMLKLLPKINASAFLFQHLIKKIQCLNYFYLVENTCCTLKQGLVIFLLFNLGCMIIKYCDIQFYRKKNQLLA